MDNKDFQPILRRLKAHGRLIDAALQDVWGRGDGIVQEKNRRKFHDEGIELLQGDLDKLIAENDLTADQIRALGSITYTTPGYQGARDCNVGKVCIMEPFTGVFDEVPNLSDGAEKMYALFVGAGVWQIQGPKSGYKVARLERPKAK